MPHTTPKKTRKVYFDQHKAYFRHNDLFNRFYQYAVSPKNYCLENGPPEAGNFYDFDASNAIF